MKKQRNVGEKEYVWTRKGSEKMEKLYFILSLEEVVRFVISIVLFRKKIWMEQL